MRHFFFYEFKYLNLNSQVLKILYVKKTAKPTKSNFAVSNIYPKKNYIPPRIPKIIPPIITEPIWPETLALTACIKIKFWSSSSKANF